MADYAEMELLKTEAELLVGAIGADGQPVTPAGAFDALNTEMGKQFSTALQSRLTQLKLVVPNYKEVVNAYRISGVAVNV